MGQFLVIATVFVLGVVLVHEGSSMKLPDDKITRNYFGWTVLDNQFSASSIMMTKTKRGHLFALVDGSIIGIRPNKNFTFAPARNINVISASKDIKLFSLIDSNHNIYKCADSVCTPIGSYSPSNMEEKVPKVIVKKGGDKICLIIANVTEHGFSWQIANLASKQAFVEADDISCSTISTMKNVVCYFIRGRELFTTNITKECEKTNDVNIATDNGISPIAVSVYGTELWVIVEGGKWALRRLGMTNDRIRGTSWMKFPLYLPSEAKSIVVGSEDVFILMKSGQIAKFQGFKRPEKATNHTFIDIETYDNKKVIALGAPNGSVLQQNSMKGYVYELKSRLNSTWKRIDIPRVICGEDRFTGPVTIGEGGIMIVEKDRSAICNASDYKTWQKKAVSQHLDVAFVDKGSSVVTLMLDQHSYNCTDPPMNIKLSKDVSNKAVTCKPNLCYLLDDQGNLYPLNNPCYGSTHSVISGDQVNDKYAFSQIDISKSGVLVAVESSTNDVFVSPASSDSYDRRWMNIPGIKLKSIAVGDGIIYGIGEDGGMAYMERTNANWGSWSPWGNCSKPCNTGQQMRNRTCYMYQPSPTLGGSNCTGNDTQLRKCNIHFCEDNCIRAKNARNKTTCCYLPNTVYGINAVSFYNSCMPMSNCTFSCPLDKNATVFGECVPMTQYSPWTSWSECSRSCFTGLKYRNRTVTNTTYTRRIMTNSATETATAYCNRHPCNVNDSTWAIRRNGTETICYFNETNKLCSKNATDGKYYCYLDRYRLDTGICREKDGNFSDWSDWSKCDSKCFTGMQNRTRNCSNPAPLYGGKCHGIDFQEEYCNNQSCVAESKCINATFKNGPLECCVLNYTLADGSIWNDCLHVGEKYICPLDRYKRRNGTCEPINGGVSGWSNWTNCNETCFTGFRIRTRNCTNPPPQYGGKCTEHTFEREICNEKPCYDKSNCTNATVGGATVCCAFGIELRTRGRPLHECEKDGEHYICPLDRYENNTGICDKIPGYFTPWSNWTDCDCKTKAEKRTREYIKPKYGGAEIVGNTTETRNCDTSHCPPEVYWTNWTIASPCPVTCGIGLQTWSRSCKRLTGETAPESECDGDAIEKRNCSEGVCPGFKLGKPGQNCTQICDDLTLTCYWSNSIKADYRTVMNRFLQDPCTQPTEGKRQWTDDWQPAYLANTRECVGYENVKGSRCTTIKPVNSTVRRLCRCIYKDDLIYSEWSEWSTWSRECGEAYKTRNRTCQSTDKSKCVKLREDVTDKIRECPDDLGFDNWASWSPCTKPCNAGYSHRARLCNNPTYCFGHKNESKLCNTDPCKVHGQFTEWSNWSVCSKSCGSGLIERTRSCTNPAPENGGNNCTGTTKENITCNTFHCSGLYLSSLNKECNQTCFEMGLSCWPHIDTKNTTEIYSNILSKANEQTVQITCSSTSSNAKWTHKYDPSYNRYTKECMGYKAVPHKVFCNDSKVLPTNVSRLCNCQNSSDIGYGEWSPWGECSASCGLGSRTRFRTCSGGCSGSDVDRGSCKIKNCPVNGGFTEFTVWSPCSKTCGGGKTYRYRYCTNPKPRDGGLDCDGNRQEEDECNMQICPVHGMWSSWGKWSLCSKPCNNGTEERTRFCDNPAPRHGGRYCIGSGTLKRVCNTRPCKPVSIGITARFYEEIFHPDLENRSTPAFKALEAKIEHNVRGIYKFQSHVMGVEVIFFQNGSVISNFTVNYTEVTSLELITLLTSLQEDKMLNVMPLSYYSLKTAEIPAPPSSLNCTAVSSSAIHVKWKSFTALITNFEITGYNIMYKRIRDASAASWKSFVVSNSSTDAYLTRLEAYTTYTIRVTAVTIDASGIPSDYEDVVTLQGPPTKPPNNVSCAVTSSTTIYCQWAMVPTINQNGDINQYIIKYQKYKDPSNMITKNEWKYLHLKSTQLYHTITGLIPYTRYEIQIHAATIAGEGPGHWLTLKTDEDVPSAAPPNLRTESRKSNVYIDFFWDKIPANSWNGKPTGLKLIYSVTRKGSTNIIGGPITNVELAADLTRHRIVGLEANWEVTLYIQGMTAAGAGVRSSSVVAETCLCNEKLYCAWYKKNPYTFKENNVMKGVFPDFFASMMSTICGTCGAYNKTTVYFDRTKNGRSAYRSSESDLKAKVSNDVHFNTPISGKKDIQIFEGVYQYVNMIDGTASVFIAVDNTKVSKTTAIMTSIFQCWPIFVVTFLMTVLAGILIWMADQFTNPEEMPTGKFLLGVIQGFWWAFVSMTTVGYGDISPRGTMARSIAILWTAIGLVVNGILVSSLSTALTVVTVNEQTKIYGANVSAVYNSPEYYLGIRRNGNMNSTGRNFNTSKQALDALIRREVQGTLLELNEAANLQDLINANGLKIAKKIASTSGMGFVLSGEMASFHSQIRSYVGNSFDVIQALVKNYTKTVVVPVVKKSTGSVTGLFDKDSPIFKELLTNSLIVLAVLIILGLVWNYGILTYLKRRNRVHAAKTDNEIIMDHYDKWSGELLDIVEEFMESMKVIEQLSDKQGFDRFRLLLKHFETLPFGLPMWLRYGTTDDRYILAKLKIEEAFLENLNKKKKPPRKKRPSLHLVDMFHQDELKVEEE